MPAHDFDFLFGRWSVRHRKLVDTMDRRCDHWTEWETVTEASPILGGLGNADETTGVLPDGTAFAGYSLRLYDPAIDSWGIWWASTNQPGALDDPVYGRLDDGGGTFVGAAEHDGTRFLARFHWRDCDTNHPVWEQDFSFDDGATWAPINWTMVHTRIA